MPGPFPFKQILAADPSNPAMVARNGEILLFAPGDATMTPLVIWDLSHTIQLPNPVTVNDLGFGPAFIHDTLDQVAWSGGGLTGTFESYRGMKDVATAAEASSEASATSSAQSAQSALDAADNAATAAAAGVQAQLAATAQEATDAKTAAQQAAQLVNAPADTVTAALVGNPASATGAALSAATAALNEVQIPPLVAEVIAADQTAVNAAAAAVNTAMAGKALSFTLAPVTGEQTAAFAATGTPNYVTPARFGTSFGNGVLYGPGTVPEPTTGSVTVEAWVYATSAPASDNRVIWSLGGDVWLALRSTTGYATIAINGATESAKVYSPASVCNSAWHHIAVELGRSAGVTTFKGMWVDGVPVTATPTIVAKAWVPNLTIGGIDPANGSYNIGTTARIDELRVSNAKRYTSTFTPQSAPFSADGPTILLAHMEDGNYVKSTNSAYPSRPSVPAGFVTYIGPDEPSDWLTGDRWYTV